MFMNVYRNIYKYFFFVKMLFKYCDRVVLTVLLLGLCTRFNAVAESGEKFRIEGRALVYGVRTEEWTPLAHVLLDGEEHVGFVRFYNLFEWGNSYNTMHQLSYRMFLTLLCPTRLDGSFTVNDVPSGSYVVHVASPVYRFEPVRVDITAAGKMRYASCNIKNTIRNVDTFSYFPFYLWNRIL